jgi:hypothetical protein
MPTSETTATARRDRLVLFLDRVGDVFRPVGTGGDLWGTPRLNVSIGWIERGDVFAIADHGFGAQYLSFEMSESLARERVERLTAIRTEFQRARSIADVRVRASALEPLVRNGHFRVAEEATFALAECGEAAVSTLSKLLSDSALDPQLGDRVSKALASIGNGTAKSEIVRHLDDEATFWKTRGGLRPDERVLDHDTNEWHYERTKSLILALTDAPDPKARQTLLDIEKAWGRLRESSGASTMDIPDLAEQAVTALEKR